MALDVVLRLLKKGHCLRLAHVSDVAVPLGVCLLNSKWRVTMLPPAPTAGDLDDVAAGSTAGQQAVGGAQAQLVSSLMFKMVQALQHAAPSGDA